MIRVFYKSKEITDGVSMLNCYHDMYAEGRTDTLNVVFDDSEHVWDSWGVKTDDEVRVEYGAIKTGKMFVYKARPKNGRFEIIATSAPASFRDRKNKAWQKVKLKAIGQEIARNHGLSFKSFGVEDRMYDYLLQENESDAKFLTNRCALEGCAFLVYDGELIMYSEKYMEDQGAKGEPVLADADTDYDYDDKSGFLYGSCTIEQGSYKGVYEAQNGANKVYIPDLNFTVTSKTEADRYAMNMLRNANKYAVTGYLYQEVLTGYAAGSMMQIENERAPSWNGEYFLTHVRNDYKAGKSKIFFRKPIEGGY